MLQFLSLRLKRLVRKRGQNDFGSNLLEKREPFEQIYNHG